MRRECRYETCGGGELDGGTIRDGCCTCGGDSTNVFDAEPEVFEGRVGVPLDGEFVAVGFQIAGLEGSVGGSEMLNDRHLCIAVNVVL